MKATEEKQLQEKIQFYETVLNNMLNGVIITDPEGKVIFFSESYGRFLGKNPREQIGLHATEVVENSRMHIVAKTGIPEINDAQRIMDHDMVVQRIPIKKDGKLVAVFGQVMFEDVRDVQVLANKLSILESKVKLYEKELVNLRASKYNCRNIIGKSSIMTELRKLAVKAAKTNAPILLMGESGTGKELFAHAIHHASDRQAAPFVRINCAAIPKDLMESELFGYEPGAYTGAGSKSKPGKFELAHQGTIFLDEITELPLEMQPKLLRVLEEKEVERLGGTRVTKCDFRLIAATHANLEQRVKEGYFRQDLYYRINVIPLNIPPLKERKEDIAMIAEHLVQTLSKDCGTNISSISPEVIKIFEKYDWPGNIRELSNVLERIFCSIEGIEDMICVEHLPVFFRGLAKKPAKSASIILKKIKEDSEKEALLQAIHVSSNNKNKASKLLGIHRTALYKKMKKFDIPLTNAKL
ncbi:MAG: sigma 54-interacting transcriptional regulator [Smithella sp.]|jgi:PAS domain S-box-containing protein